jgi:cobalt/nickel transport system ATP-binding protein
VGVPAVDIRALVHAYADGTQALRGVDLRIDAGEAVAIVGANGAGKSTLLKHLNGLLLPAGGSVHIEGIALTRASLADVRRRVGYVFQDADDQLFMPTVQDDVAFGPMNLGLAADEAQARAAAALSAVDAAHLAARAPYRLSGGEKRAVAIAGVLAMAPSILVLDEPSTGLDPAGRRRLIELLGRLPQTRIVATHDLGLVLQSCPRALVLHEGRVVADGTPARLFTDAELLRRCQLEPPYEGLKPGPRPSAN